MNKYDKLWEYLKKNNQNSYQLLYEKNKDNFRI